MMNSNDELAKRFAFFLRRAKDQFETLQRVISQGSADSGRVRISIMQALIDSVLYSCARADRLARHAPDVVGNVGVDVNQFKAFMKDVNDVRNVSEHWQDVINPRKTKRHDHVSRGGLKISLDETSLIVVSPDEVYVGPLNIHDVYLYISEVLAVIERQKRPAII